MNEQWRWWLSKLPDDAAIVTKSRADYSHVPGCEEVEVVPLGTMAELDASTAAIETLTQGLAESTRQGLHLISELASCIRISGEAIGTDPEYRSTACVQVLADHYATVKAELAALREESREKFCATCKHWEAYYVGSKTGVCHNGKSNYATGEEVDGFEPESDFGCIYHEPMPTPKGGTYV